MGSKSVHAPASAAAPFPSTRSSRARPRPRRWHPVVYLGGRGPVRFAGHATMREAFAQARELALALGARTWSVAPGRATVLADEGGRDD
ncbi:hypothetical protein [Quisquiliibacterium transsilvanicum]|uniref:Uncharacterized protein n=1 Tax=Quisquiliibacterium transsilvanicum TaxID=1549638 RepID=A0A7W8HEF3_9BURK|nr:hypothetical protein [Quisquiliibacterium transsilvanicum]MBB5270322.1 hypothetical protein [Quisquiliibacterium transsilvanicum]